VDDLRGINSFKKILSEERFGNHLIWVIKRKSQYEVSKSKKEFLNCRGKKYSSEKHDVAHSDLLGSVAGKKSPPRRIPKNEPSETEENPRHWGAFTEVRFRSLRESP